MINRVFKISVIMVLAVACGLVAWHVVSWHATGRHDLMDSWLGSEKAYLTVLYNLGLVLVFGLLMGTLTDRIVETLMSFNNRDKRNQSPPSAGGGSR